MQRPEEDTGCLSLLLSLPYSLEIESLTEQKLVLLARLAGHHAPSPGICLFLSPSNAGVIGTHHQAQLLVLMGAEDSSSGSSVCTYPPIYLPALGC